MATGYVYYNSDKGCYRVTIYKNGVGKAKVTVDGGWSGSRTIAVTCKRADFALATTKYTFSKDNYGTYYWPYAKHSGITINRDASSNPSVVEAAMVGDSYKSPRLMAKKAGKAKIT